MHFRHHGTNLSVFDQGGSGTPVIFQHGLCGSAAQTREVFPGDSRCRLITVECRGHGASKPGPLADLAIATFAGDVAAFMQKQNLGPCIVGGISMGAAIAQHLAVHQPALVKALVLARPAWVAKAAPKNVLPNAEVGELLRCGSPAAALEKFQSGETARRLRHAAPDNLASLVGFFSREPVAVTSALLTAIANDGPGTTEDELKALNVPTLVIGHARDDIHPLAHANQLASLIPHATLAEITPKAVDKARYIADFQMAMIQFFDKVEQS